MFIVYCLRLDISFLLAQKTGGAIVEQTLFPSDGFPFSDISSSIEATKCALESVSGDYKNKMINNKYILILKI